VILTTACPLVLAAGELVPFQAHLQWGPQEPCFAALLDFSCACYQFSICRNFDFAGLLLFGLGAAEAVVFDCQCSDHSVRSSKDSAACTIPGRYLVVTSGFRESREMDIAIHLAQALAQALEHLDLALLVLKTT